MSDEQNVVEEVVPSDEPEEEGDATPGEEGETEEDVEKLPLHLHPRGKQLVEEKNRFKEKVNEYERFGTPEELARKLARLDIAEEILAEEPKEPKKAAPRTKEEVASAEERAWAREQLLDLLPEVKDLAERLEKTEESAKAAEAFKSANAELAWEQTCILAEEIGITPEALSKMTIPTIGEDKNLLRQYNAGRSDKAVTEAVKKLGLGKDKDTKPGDLKRRAEEIKQGEETSSKLPKAHRPGGKSPAPAAPEEPTTWDEAAKRTTERLDKIKL